MNRHTLPIFPNLSSALIHRRRSLFDVEFLLSLRTKTQTNPIALRTVPITRWNE
jgi:hypothetical protein